MVLNGSRILVVEDEYFLADEMRSILTRLGAIVLGPVPTVNEALALIESDPAIDYALLDLNLGGQFAFRVADMLRLHEIPFAFVTGYGRGALPEHHAAVVQLEKPVRAKHLIQLLLDHVDEAPARSPVV